MGVTLYLTSSPVGAYRSETEEVPQCLNSENHFVENLREDWVQGSWCLLICADPDAWESNDEMARFFEKIFHQSGLETAAFDLCDSRNAREMTKSLFAYQMIILGGGHVPTQNEFLKSSGLLESLREYSGIVMGISAGTMNCAATVYAQPELQGESISGSYQRFIEGIGYTNINVLPHYQAVKEDVLDGRRLMEDITYPDSFGKKFYALPDGSYIRQNADGAYIFGEAYLISEGRLEQISRNGEIRKIHQRRKRYKGTHPRTFEEKYKELQPEKYADTVEKVIRKGGTPAGMHISICVREILEFLQIQPGQTGLDATLGYGGHTKKMLECLQGDGHIYGLDVDPIEIEKTKKRLETSGYGEDILTVLHRNFAEIDEVAAEYGPFDFVLADLGVSSMQIDNPKRGFSYKTEGPLDLRLNPEKGVPASQRLKELTREELEGMLVENSDEPYAPEIAETVIRKLQRGKEIETTTQMKAAIEEALSFLPEDRQKKDTVKKTCQRVFQALRIDVNSEFEALELFLNKLADALAPGGRVAILTFHSGEDRMVKKAFKRYYREGVFCEISREVIRPSAEECRNNGRARSTKMRWAVKKKEGQGK